MALVRSPSVLSLALGSALLVGSAQAVGRQAGPHGADYAMTAQDWSPAAPAPWAGAVVAAPRFARYEGLPTGAMTLNEGLAVSNAAHFADGVLEFDIKPLEYSDTGVVLRRDAAGDGEFFYIRANPDCPAANDCVQYAPITHGLMQWDIYPNRQASADVATGRWTHVKIEVSGRQARVYVGDAVRHVLEIARLQGLTDSGGVAFKGPAIYANVKVGPAPHALDLSTTVTPPGVITDWRAAPPVAWSRGRTPTSADVPVSESWRPIASEPDGLVNLSRAFGPGRTPAMSLAWLRTTIRAPSGAAILHVGYARQLWMFIDGRSVFAGANPYYPTQARIGVDGRLDPENVVIPLQLTPGAHELLLAVGNDWTTAGGLHKPSPYGWGAEARIEPPGDGDDPVKLLTTTASLAVGPSDAARR